MLRQTAGIVKAGVHSFPRIDKQMNPFEYIWGWIGGLPIKMTSGDSKGYLESNLNCKVNCSFSYKLFLAPLKLIWTTDISFGFFFKLQAM